MTKPKETEDTITYEEDLILEEDFKTSKNLVVKGRIFGKEQEILNMIHNFFSQRHSFRNEPGWLAVDRLELKHLTFSIHLSSHTLSYRAKLRNNHLFYSCNFVPTSQNQVSFNKSKACGRCEHTFSGVICLKAMPLQILDTQKYLKDRYLKTICNCKNK